MSKSVQSLLLVMTGLALALSMPVFGQNTETPPRASIIGTVTDANGDVVPNAAVALKGFDIHDERTVTTNENGFFQFRELKPGIAYQIKIHAKDFADWTSPTVTLDPGQFKILAGIQLRIETERTTVQVTYDPVEVATEQFRAEETQRVFGIIPNFYVSYDPNAEALTARRKFELALKVSSDPVTAAGVLLVASAKQAGNSPKYGQGWGAFGERVGATTADGLTDIMVGGAILPTLLHQDPGTSFKGPVPRAPAFDMPC